MTQLTLFYDFGGRSILIRSGSLTMLERIFWIFHKLSLLKSLMFSSLRAPSSSLLLIRRLGDSFRDIVLPSTVNLWAFISCLGQPVLLFDLVLILIDVMTKKCQLIHSLLSPTIIKGSLALNARWLGTPSLEASSLCNMLYEHYFIQHDEWPLTCLQMGAYLLMEMSKTKTDPSWVSTAKMVLECWDQDTSDTCNMMDYHHLKS